MNPTLRHKYKKRLQQSVPLSEQLIDDLEECTFRYCLQSGLERPEMFYINICRFLSNNLSKSCAQSLVQQLSSGQLSAQQLLELEPFKFDPTEWKTVLANNLYLAESATKENKATTNDYWCSRCKRNKCTYFERQDRSSDEPMTIHITCCHCGHKWKQ